MRVAEVDAHVDTGALDKWLIKRAVEMGVGLGGVLRLEMSQLVELLARVTPPTDGTLSPGQGWAVQKRVGRNALLGDLAKVYTTSASVVGMLKDKEGGDDGAKAFSKAVRGGDVPEAQRLLYAFGLGDMAVGRMGAFDADVHKRRKNRRGRVRGGQVGMIVTDRAALNQYKREQLAKVGQLKRGWAMAGRGLKRKPKMPAWIARAQGGGSGKLVDSTRLKRDPYISVENTSKHAASQNRILRFSDYALSLRAGKVRRSVRSMVNRKWKR